MSPQLRNLLILSFTAAVGGITYVTYVPTPPDVKNSALKAAGLTDGEMLVQVCPERLTDAAAANINKQQPGALRPGQRYARVGRVGFCFSDDGGTCLSSGVPLRAGALVVPSLRQAAPDAGFTSDAGEEDTDDALRFSDGACRLVDCVAFRTDAGLAANWCNVNRSVNGVALAAQPCMIPNGWKGADGGWDETGQVDCLFTGPYGLPDGGARWRGFNVGPREYATGGACVPVECSVVAGDVPQEWL